MILLRSLAFQAALYLFTAATAILGLPVLMMPRRLASRFGCGWAAAVLKICAWTIGLSHELRGASSMGRPATAIAAVKR